MRNAAQEEAEARSAEVSGLERRLAAALASASRAESEAATCVEVSPARRAGPNLSSP